MDSAGCRASVWLTGSLSCCAAGLTAVQRLGLINKFIFEPRHSYNTLQSSGSFQDYTDALLTQVLHNVFHVGDQVVKVVALGGERQVGFTVATHVDGHHTELTLELPQLVAPGEPEERRYSVNTLIWPGFLHSPHITIMASKWVPIQFKTSISIELCLTIMYSIQFIMDFFPLKFYMFDKYMINEPWDK